MVKQKKCDIVMTLCLHKDENDAVEVYQNFIKSRESKRLNKEQIINRIIREWAEDRNLILEVTKK